MKITYNYLYNNYATYLTRSYDFHSYNAQVLALFVYRHCYLKVFPKEKVVYHVSMGPYIAKEIELQRPRLVKILQLNTFSTAAMLSEIEEY